MKRHPFTSAGMALVATLILAFVGAIPARADASADLSISSHVGSPDPVEGSNTVSYAINVFNAGPTSAPSVHVKDYMSCSFEGCTPEGTLTSAFGTGWTCSVFLGDADCDYAALASGATANTLFVLVQAPSYATTMSNSAHVTTDLYVDPNPDNDYSTVDTTVVVTTTCSPGQASCGSGFITYAQDSSVTFGTDATPATPFVGTWYFKGKPGVSGGEVWSAFSPVTPDAICPTKTIVLKLCSFQVTAKVIPFVYSAADVKLVAICDVSVCPAGPLGSTTLIMSRINDHGGGKIILTCAVPLLKPCFTTTRTADGDLQITIDGIAPGDPRVAGICLRGGC